jgi:hypothetical protein
MAYDDGPIDEMRVRGIVFGYGVFNPACLRAGPVMACASSSVLMTRGVINNTNSVSVVVHDVCPNNPPITGKLYSRSHVTQLPTEDSVV